MEFASLGHDLTEVILSHLPIQAIVRATAVCKLWRSILHSPSFAARVAAAKKPPWFFLYGQNNVLLKSNQAFAFEPESFRWIRLPSPHGHDEALFAAAGGFFFAAAPNFCYAPIPKGAWRHTSPLHVSRCDPLVGVFNGSATPWFIVAGGVRYVGGLVDMEDRPTVEVYDPCRDSWELCPPLPADFPTGSSSQWLSSALFMNKFYVHGIYSGFVSSFDLNERVWSRVQVLKPAGVRFSSLIACEGQLVLGGLRFASHGGPGGVSFELWSIDEETLELREMVVMPEDLLYELFERSEGEDKFATLKCVGGGNLIFVFNEEYYRHFPACVYDVGRSRWRRVPLLPFPLNQFHKLISFCSTVSLSNVLGIEV